MVAITGNGLKTMDVLQGSFEAQQAIRPVWLTSRPWSRRERKFMSVKVVLPNAFQKHTNGAREIQSTAQNLPQLIAEIETSFPALKPHLRDNDRGLAAS